MSRVAFALGIAWLLASQACRVPAPSIRFGAERTTIAYDDRYAAEKRALLERINRDRERHGLAPLAWEARAALVGDRFCLDAALAGSVGHWDLSGRAPYVRWGLAGGVDYHAQNVSAYGFPDAHPDRPLLQLLIAAHETMLAETPPDDGHRRTILDPAFTHVGIGIAIVGGQFRMTQEFTRTAFQWIELPEAPLPRASEAWFAGQLLEGWEPALIEIRREPPPRALTLLEARSRGAYGYPDIVDVLRPVLVDLPLVREVGPDAFAWDHAGRVSARFRLKHGPGHYFVLCYVRRRGTEGPVGPATAAMVTALP